MNNDVTVTGTKQKIVKASCKLWSTKTFFVCDCYWKIENMKGEVVVLPIWAKCMSLSSLAKGTETSLSLPKPSAPEKGTFRMKGVRPGANRTLTRTQHSCQAPGPSGDVSRSLYWRGPKPNCKFLFISTVQQILKVLIKGRMHLWYYLDYKEKHKL